MKPRRIQGSNPLKIWCVGLVGSLMVLLAPLSHAQNANSTQPAPPPISDHLWPKLSIGLQNEYLTSSLSQEGVLNDAWFISQSAYGVVHDRSENAKQEPDTDLKRFIELTNDEIEASFTRYVGRNPQLRRQTTNTLIIDIEYPVHPKDFWKLLDGEHHDQITPEFTGVVQAFARRCAITRKFFPKAQLTIYGMGMPDGQGRTRAREQQQLNAEILATKMGLLEDINAISPVLYERFGIAEPAFKNSPRATKQCLMNCLQIIQASHTPLDILVLMSLTIFNGNSKNTKRPADLEGIADRLSYLHQLGVRRVIFWNGGETLTGTNIPIKQRFQQLRRLEATRRSSEAEDSVPTDSSPPPGVPEKP